MNNDTVCMLCDMTQKLLLQMGSLAPCTGKAACLLAALQSFRRWCLMHSKQAGHPLLYPAAC